MKQIPDNSKRKITVKNTSNGSVVCSCGSIANTFLKRLVGLLGKKQLAAGDGMLLVPSSGVHTWGMSFAIDIVGLDRSGRVLSAHANVAPWRMRYLGGGARTVLELPAGRIASCAIQTGDRLAFCRNAA